jgi:Calcineurin-like phosphoesterase
MRAGLALAASVATTSALAAPDPTFVVLREDGQATARIITTADSCPEIMIDGRSSPMTIRAEAETVPLRPTQSTPENSKPSAFPVLTCDAMLPARTQNATIAGHHLPRVAEVIRRIIVIGDTGCRLKAADKAYQACNDPAAFLFARIATQAATWKPDLVIHVGDYHYHENPCADRTSGCTDSPWGYGWDAWNADLFTPGAPLLAAAPWVVVRGNHENCPRAGQGWWRFLDPRPLTPRRDCNHAEDDDIGDAASTYAVPIGGGARIIVADLATAPDKSIKTDDPRFAQFAAAHDAISSLSKGSTFAFLATHKTILGIAATLDNGTTELRAATIGTQSVFATKDANILPSAIDTVLSGHVHIWEQVSYPARYPSQFITGFSGTVEDVAPLPQKLPTNYSPVPDVTPDAFSSWVDGFGYMTLERQGARQWDAKVWSVDGRIMNRCKIVGRRSHCRVARVT